MDRLNKFLCVTLISLTLASPVLAQTQGSEGETSTGNANISVEIPKLVKITGLNNLTMTGLSKYTGGAAGFDQNDPVCIYSNMDTGSGEYTVRITGDSNPKASPSAGFYVGNATTDQEIVYDVEWNDQATTGGTNVDSGIDLNNQTGFTNDAACGSSNANIRVTMTQADLLAVRPATYTGRIVILITPE
ncbi:MAG: hypothetical protein EBZ48_01425 [Proteobacteria bacterium]|nr:hypothetical protein [Pseudomonadota bacterium]